jgi:hypothetical protein
MRKNNIFKRRSVGWWKFGLPSLLPEIEIHRVSFQKALPLSLLDARRLGPAFSEGHDSSGFQLGPRVHRKCNFRIFGIFRAVIATSAGTASSTGQCRRVSSPAAQNTTRPSLVARTSQWTPGIKSFSRKSILGFLLVISPSHWHFKCMSVLITTTLPPGGLEIVFATLCR